MGLHSVYNGSISWHLQRYSLENISFTVSECPPFCRMAGARPHQSVRSEQKKQRLAWNLPFFSSHQISLQTFGVDWYWIWNSRTLQRKFHTQPMSEWQFFAPLWLAHYAVLVYLGNGAINSGAGAILRQLFNFNQNLAAAGPRLACQWTFTKCWKIIKCENMLYMYHHHQILVYFPSEKWGTASNKQFIWRVCQHWI